MTARVPLLDLKAQYRSIRKDIDRAIHRVVRGASFILGEEVGAFEQAFAAFTGTGHCLGVGSGTAALHLALLATGIGPGDEVITTPLTFVATAEAIRHAGARPVFVDVEKDTLCLDPDLVAAALTTKTKGIVAVHLHGHPASMDGLLAVGARSGIPVIEDAAQAHGATYRGRPAGSLGSCGCFSFYPGKNLGAYGDAGAVVSSDPGLMEKIRLLRDHGRRSKHEHVLEGYNHRMDSIQAAVLSVKLSHLPDWNRKRRRIADRYRKGLERLVECPREGAAQQGVYHVFAIRTPVREKLGEFLSRHGIETGIHYPVPLHLQPCFRFLGYKPGQFPVAEQAARHLLSLPIFPEMTGAQVEFVIDRVRAFFNDVPGGKRRVS